MVRTNTQAVHSGETPDPTTGALAPPIYQTTSYAHEGPGENQGYCYTRTGNPTVDTLARKLAELEGGVGAACFGSGLAAVDAVFRNLDPGDHVLVSRVAYGGTVRQLERIHKRWGLDVDYVDTTNPDAVRAAIRPETKLLFVETPANPTLDVSDLAALGRIAEETGVLFAVDNTFHTPALQRPFEQGADVVVHSTTKYLEGHGTTIGGAVVVRDDEELLEEYRFLTNACGAILDPFAAWQTLLGIKTLPLRVKHASETALALADALDQRDDVDAVHYPGLPTDPGYKVNARQASAGGGVLAFEVDGGTEAATAFVEALDLLVLGENLGQAETLVSHPATMTHAAVPREQRLELGIRDGLLRVSVGYEDRQDVIEDVEQALDAVAKQAPAARGGAYR